MIIIILIIPFQVNRDEPSTSSQRSESPSVGSARRRILDDEEEEEEEEEEDEEETCYVNGNADTIPGPSGFSQTTEPVANGLAGKRGTKRRIYSSNDEESDDRMSSNKSSDVDVVKGKTLKRREPAVATLSAASVASDEDETPIRSLCHHHLSLLRPLLVF